MTSGGPDLTAAQLQAVLALRAAVFVVEQDCPYQDVDGRDLEAGTRHIWTAGADGGVLSYLRVLTEPDGGRRVGRVCTTTTARGAGRATGLMTAALAEIGDRTSVLDAQTRARGFYERFGYVVTGPEFVEDAIPHVPMRRPARSGCDLGGVAGHPSPVRARFDIMTIKVGDRIPDVTVRTMGAEGPTTVSTGDVLGSGKVVLFAVPGAFTPGCSQVHLPSFVEGGAALKAAKGVDTIACVSVNDPFVMAAWGAAQGVTDDIVMLADGNADFTEAIGMTMDGSGFGLGTRSKRYAAVLQDGVVVSIEVDEQGVSLTTCSSIALTI